MRFSLEDRARWEQVQRSLAASIKPEYMYESLIKPVQLYAVLPEKIVLIAPDSMVISHLKTRFFTDLYSVIATVFRRTLEMDFYTQEELDKKLVPDGTNLLKKFTFENFVVGPSNQLAHAASQAVAESPGTCYNPLFIYGGSGLGKTHLINAIGNAIINQNPSANIQSVTAEQFTNQLIETLRKKEDMRLMRDKMRSVDVLIIDDVQFFSKTTTTQEEVFHTFNTLHAGGKQIILSSDRPPRDIPTLEERLITRFSMGLMVDIKNPDYETRLAILQRKCDEKGIQPPYEVLEYIAQHVVSNIRELEGALNRVELQSNTMDRDIDLEITEEALSQVITDNKSNEVTSERILRIVAQERGVLLEDIMGSGRSKPVAQARQFAMYLMQNMMGMSTTAIGQTLGRDHSTVMHGIKQVADRVTLDPSTKSYLESLKETIRTQK